MSKGYLDAEDQKPAAKRTFEVGAGEPASGSTVTARVTLESTAPVRMCIAVPCGPDWNRPAGRGEPPFGITHISYVLPAGSAGKFEAISKTPMRGLRKKLPRGGAGWPCPKFTCRVSGWFRNVNACVQPVAFGGSLLQGHARVRQFAIRDSLLQTEPQRHNQRAGGRQCRDPFPTRALMAHRGQHSPPKPRRRHHFLRLAQHQGVHPQRILEVLLAERRNSAQDAPRLRVFPRPRARPANRVRSCRAGRSQVIGRSYRRRLGQLFAQYLQRRPDPGLDGPQRLLHALGHLGLRKPFVVSQLHHCLLMRGQFLESVFDPARAVQRQRAILEIAELPGMLQLIQFERCPPTFFRPRNASNRWRDCAPP